MYRSPAIACILALLGSFLGVLLSMAMALALWDGPPEGEYRGYQLYYRTVLMGCISTLFLFVAWYKDNNTCMKQLAACALLVCAGILLVAIAVYVRAAHRLSPRAYVSLPLPLVLWVAAAT